MLAYDIYVHMIAFLGRVEAVLLCAEGQHTQGGPDRLQARRDASQTDGSTSGADRLKALRGGPDMPKARRAVQIG